MTKLSLHGSLEQLKSSDAQKLHQILIDYKGGATRFELQLETQSDPIRLNWPETFGLKVDEILLESLRKFWGRKGILLSY